MGRNVKLVIGLDGGGTGSRARALREDGSLGATIHGGSANVHSDPTQAVSNIRALLAAVLAAEATHALDDPELFIVMGLAGAAETGAHLHLHRALPCRNMTILGDIDIALSGALEDQDGIVLAVGTGSVLARQRAGRMTRAGGYGFALGDEGGGAWIGRKAMTKALHVRDGLLPTAPLADAIWARFPTVADMLAFSADARPSDYAALAPDVLSHGMAGCPIARSILDEACCYFLRVIRHLQAEDTSLPVAATGGLGAVLLDRANAEAHPKLRIMAAKGTALSGALWRARQIAQFEGTRR